MVEKQPNPSYYDTELVERAAGDQELLDRLVGLDRAESLLSKDPGNESLKHLVENMQLVVREYIEGRDRS